MKICGVNLFSVAILLLSASLTHRVGGATVSTCDEAGLRTAVSEGGTITFACDGVVTLTTPILVTNNVVLDGNGHDVTISGGGTDRLFTVNSNAALTAMHLKMVNGRAIKGGAILNNGGSLHLADVLFSTNRTIEERSFIRNPAEGGAIFSSGTLIATNCIFQDNVADGRINLSGWSGGSGSKGGAIRVQAGTAVILNCRFSRNAAIGSIGDSDYSGYPGLFGVGGAICNNGDLFLRGGIFEHNLVIGGEGGTGDPFRAAQGGDGANASGGAIQNLGILRAHEVQFLQNGAIGGTGGIGRDGVFSFGRGGIGGSGGKGGSASGAAIYNLGQAQIIRCTFINNIANGGSAGMSGNGGMSGGEGSSGSFGGAALGGAIFGSTGSVIVTNCTFAGNEAVAGLSSKGGNGGQADIAAPIGGNGGKGGNGADALGATLYLSNTVAVVASCTIASNSVTAGMGQPGGSLSCGRYGICGTNGLPGSDGVAGGAAIFVAETPGTSLQLFNTILVGNGDHGLCIGPIVDGGHNLSSDWSCPFISPDSVVGIDPSLGGLETNQNGSITFALLPNSHAIDSGDCASSLPHDQRGVLRPMGAACDIGATEYEGSMLSLQIAASITQEIVSTGSAFNLRVQLANPNSVAVSNVSFALDLPSELIVTSGSVSNSCQVGLVQILPMDNIVAGSEFIMGPQSECIVDIGLTCLVPGVWQPSALTISSPAMGIRYSMQLDAVRAIAEPDVLTLGITGLGTNSVTLNALVNPNGASTRAWFEWGDSVALGDVTEVLSIGEGFVALPVSATLAGLPPNRVFYYRIVATNTEGLVRGNLREGFTTGGKVVQCTDENLRANLDAGGTVTFDCDGTLVLTNSLEITRDTIIDGGRRTVAIDGKDEVRLFNIRSGAKLTVLNLTLTGGRCTNGGALYIEPGSGVHLSNCSVIGNRAIGQSGVSGTNGANGDPGTLVTPGTDGQPGKPGMPGQNSFGGAIFNAGTLSAIASTFISNRVSGGSGGIGGNGGCGGYGNYGGAGGGGGLAGKAFGGAIYSTGKLSLTNSTFAWNTSSGGRGGVGGNGGEASLAYGQPGNGGAGGDAEGGAVSNAGTNAVLNSTFGLNGVFGGSGGFGGRVYNSICPSGRSGSGGNAYGGAIANTNSLTALYSTIWNNAVTGGQGTNSCPESPHSTNGISQGAAIKSPLIRPARLGNTIVGGTNISNAVQGPVVDLGHNLGSDGTPNFTAPSSRKYIDPLLGPLADNGGPTLTMSPLPGSPAIDAGDNASAPAIDQRGVPRPQGAHADIGAVEATFLTIEKLANGNMRLRYAGIPGVSYRLEETPSFTEEWSGIETNSAESNGTVHYSDQPGSSARRMFRVKSP